MSASATDQQTDTTVEQSATDEVVDQAGTAGSGVVEAEAEGAASDDAAETEASDAVELIGQSKYESLKSNPVALAKELNRAATKKFQTLARQREELEPYSDFIRALDEDPRSAIEAVARQLGMEIGGSKQEVRQQVADLNTVIQHQVRQALGPDYEDLADRLAPAMRQVAEMVAAETAKPLMAEQTRLIQETAVKESAASLESFSQKHPDWKEHEEDMVALSKKMNPGEGMSQSEYLENLYYLVTRQSSEGERLKKVVQRINKSAPAGSESTRVPASRVATRPAGNPTFAEAAAAALRGERFDND